MSNKHLVISYDIADNKRRNKLVKILMDYAYRVQESVFEVCASPEDCLKLMKKLPAIINKEEDSVIIYELCEADWKKHSQLGAETGEKDIFKDGYAVL